MNWLIGICAGIGVLKTATTSREYCPTNRVSAMKAIAGPLVALAMPFVPALLLSLALSLPTTANSKGGHGGSSHASRSASTHSYSVSSVARDSHGHIKRDPAARAAFQHKTPCPSTGKTSGPCSAYIVDHVTPLKRGEAYNASNMQLQTKQAAKEDYK